MERVLEPELMLGAAQAAAYAAADFSAPHDAAADAFVAAFPELVTAAVRVLDLGCGPADVTIRLARRLTAASFVGVDGSPAMLAEGERRIRDAGLDSRISLCTALLGDASLEAYGADVVVSTSMLHHLHDPHRLWRQVVVSGAPGAAVFVADLRRPPDRATLAALVARHAAHDPAVLREDFAHSLHAAFTVEEVRAQLNVAGLAFTVRSAGDRHLYVAGRLSADTRTRRA